MGTVTFSVKRSLYPHTVDAVGVQYAVGMQYTVDVSAKRSIHTVDLANMGGGTITFSAKRSLYPHTVDAVGMQYTVGVSAKRSTHTVNSLANIGGGDRYL